MTTLKSFMVINLGYGKKGWKARRKEVRRLVKIREKEREKNNT